MRIINESYFVLIDSFEGLVEPGDVGSVGLIKPSYRSIVDCDLYVNYLLRYVERMTITRGKLTHKVITITKGELLW